MTVKDQVAVERALTFELGIDTWYAVTGGSMGGMRALQWAVDFPDNSSARLWWPRAPPQSEQVALCSLQNEAIRLDPDFRRGRLLRRRPGTDCRLAIARGIGHLSYRSEADLQQRFANNAQDHEGR